MFSIFEMLNFLVHELDIISVYLWFLKTIFIIKYKKNKKNTNNIFSSQLVS